MPLRLVRSASNRALWEACAARFLDALGSHPGPDPHAAHLWLAHRSQRDALLERAAERGLPGWLGPPVSFFSELPGRFGIRERPIGPLAGRLLVSRLAAREGRRWGFGAADAPRGPSRAHLLDGVFSELLPEGVTPDALGAALEHLDRDDFSRRRNRWVAATYRAYLTALAERRRFDPRSVHALLARRIEDGGLGEALSGARALHVYGITSLRGRVRLLRALAEQGRAVVSVYLPLEPGASEWEETLPIEEVEVLGARADADPERSVQPVPDAHREVAWVAGRVKRILVRGDGEPHEIAVVARSGRRDLRMVHEALRAAGVPVTARLRRVLAEIPVLKALLSLFRAEGRGWDYRPLREILASPYTSVEIDLRLIDYVQSQRRVEGLEEWARALARTREALETDDRGRLRRAGVHPDRAEEAVRAFEGFRHAVAPLGRLRSEAGWVELTLGLLAGGALDLRGRLCRPVGDRQDLVRWDQRAVIQLERLLREWRQVLVEGGAADDEIPAGEWHVRLRRLLEASELALTSPLRMGVQVLEAHEAALTPFRHLFLVHANDGEFPRAPRVTGIFSEEERGLLREAGFPVATRELALRRERALWYAVTSADRLCVSYRTTDARGVPRLPSLLVPDHDPALELPRSLDSLARLEAAERAGGVPTSREAEYRRREVRRLAAIRGGGDRSPFRTPDPERLRQAVLTAFAEERRAADAVRPFHPWSGWIRDPAVLNRLQERFGDDYVWSASQLEAYAVRPFDFLLDRVLDLEEVEEADEETSPLAFGSVAHELLERFYAAALPDLPHALDEEAEALYERVADETFRAFEEDASRWLGLPALWAIDRRKIRRTVRDFLARDVEKLARDGETPVALERAFGGGRADPPVPVSGRDLVGRPARLLLRGRIDRVDRHGRGEGAWLKVVDYKSGSTPGPGGYEDGTLLQSALYLRVAGLLGLGEARCAVYRSIRGTRDGAPLERARLENVLAFALSVPSRVRAGLFEAVQAASVDIRPWQPGRAVVRTEARLSEGSRFGTAPPPDGTAPRAAEGRAPHA